MSGSNQRQPASNIPIPDPSLLTTEQLRRELQAMRDIIETRLDGMDKASNLIAEQFRRERDSTRSQLEQRIETNDQASVGRNKVALDLIGVVKSDLHEVPTQVNERLSNSMSLNMEKFSSVQRQFDERDVRAKAAEDAAKVAVNAALQAQKEAAGAQNDSNAAAITKSEAATIKQIDGILALLGSNTKAIDDKIAVINGRLDRGEGGGNTKDVMALIGGINDRLARTDGGAASHATSQTAVLAYVALAVSVIVGGYAILGSRPMVTAPPPPQVQYLPQYLPAPAAPPAAVTLTPNLTVAPAH